MLKINLEIRLSQTRCITNWKKNVIQLAENASLQFEKSLVIVDLYIAWYDVKWLIIVWHHPCDHIKAKSLSEWMTRLIVFPPIAGSRAITLPSEVHVESTLVQSLVIFRSDVLSLVRSSSIPIFEPFRARPFGDDKFYDDWARLRFVVPRAFPLISPV